MKLLLALAALSLTACAEPTVIERINIEVNHTRTYQHYAAKDYRYLKPGEGGNCAAFAETKRLELAKVGISSRIMACTLRDGVGHAFVLTDAGVLDNRFDEVVRFGDVGCR